MFAGKIAPAIATGNAVVYKPAELTPITTLELARLAIDVLPAGVINVVTGSGKSAGEAIVSHPDIRKISLAIAVSVAETAYAMKLARDKRPRDLKKAIANFMYEP